MKRGHETERDQQTERVTSRVIERGNIKIRQRDVWTTIGTVRERGGREKGSV